MKSKLLLVFAIWLAATSTGICQVNINQHLLKGIVIDSVTRKPVEAVTISLKAVGNDPIKITTTKKDGSFIFEKALPEKNTITFTSTEYQARTLIADLTDSAKNMGDLDTISLAPRITTLKAVSVIGAKPLIHQDVDRIVYDLQADPESKMNSVLGMLHKIPLLSVDASENILLNGNSDYIVLIDGKRSSLVQNNIKDVLRSMPASTIQRIEVMTNPPAKYDAEGLAGIINIITKKKSADGYNGTFKVNERGPQGGPGIGGAFSFKDGKFGMSLNGGASLFNSPHTQSSTSRTTTGTVVSDLEQNGTSLIHNRSGYLITGLSYNVDSLHLLSAQFNIRGVRINHKTTQSSMLDGASVILQQYDLNGNSTSYGNGVDVGLNYQIGFKRDKSKLLTFSYQYENDDNKQNNFVSIADIVNFPVPDYEQTNNGWAIEHTFQTDYMQQINKLSIEAGVKGILRYNKSDFEYFNSTAGQYVPDSAFSNKYNNQQDVLSVYNSYEYDLNKWQFKTGFRLEETLVNANFISSGDLVKQNYFNVLPTVNINRNLNQTNSLNLGFSQRIERPGIYQLNPYVDRSNPDFESTGNPGLRPSLSNIIELGFNRQKKSALNLVVGYIFFNNLIGPVSFYDPATQVTLTKYENTGNLNAISANIFYMHPIAKWWNIGVNANVRYARINVIVDGAPYKNNGFMDNISVSNEFNTGKGWRFNASFLENGHNLSSPQGKTNAYASTSFAVSKDMINNKINLSAGVSNPFNKFRNSREEIGSPDAVQVNNDQTYFRYFTASLNYSFGKLREQIKRSRSEIRNDDVKKGKSTGL